MGERSMNNFHEDLQFSHSAEDLEIWGTIYAKAFPGLQTFTNSRQDGELQRHGIDRTLILQSGKAIYIDEKVRRKDYGDILLEYVSNDTKNTLGWCEKPLFCDYIAYAILPVKICYLLPVEPLQTAWGQNKIEWLERYGVKTAKNKGYNTLNCPLPVNVLFKSIGATLRIHF